MGEDTQNQISRDNPAILLAGGRRVEAKKVNCCSGGAFAVSSRNGVHSFGMSWHIHLGGEAVVIYRAFVYRTV